LTEAIDFSVYQMREKALKVNLSEWTVYFHDVGSFHNDLVDITYMCKNAVIVN
jgi:hypothetical protein